MLILASSSPRRIELLGFLNIPFTAISSDIEEIIDPLLSVEQVASSLAQQKALHVFKQHPEDVVIGSDTIVVVDNTILGKPKDKEDAKRMLKLLSNKTHKVITGVCVVNKNKSKVFSSVSEVTFLDLSDKDISEYLKHDEYKGKAGAYAVQGKSALFVKHINGDFFSIMGLPISELNQVLKKFN